ncbi:hypothetical protein ACMSX5_002089 [Cronobacter turicensis]|uniref:Uncharacterized protein n=1 Tax=Cronobacter turicensis (strain DSM 18703 / CCUG 55852 / LMG 23827 / z3032) TaxID=693216 RepID=C9Y1M7_CROTZ|nr:MULTISPECIES: hypothetical protein [Cronobacter]CBA30044.1 unknown protein [Cronobacter turicensis z3032]ELY3748318.1 hypothetical protein [Cronobacter sakazakii]EMD9176724.1 hypothetical protein [Cronobacter turicensis]MDI6473441.1 hypothetical protein [Cronobacter turicensis]MEB8479662.1 hypothetical protein [Cronobacter malonaticus]
MNKQTDYRAIVERIAVILHGSITDVDLLTVTVRAMKDRIEKLEQQHQMVNEYDRTAPNKPTIL